MFSIDYIIQNYLLSIKTLEFCIFWPHIIINNVATNVTKKEFNFAELVNIYWQTTLNKRGLKEALNVIIDRPSIFVAIAIMQTFNHLTGPKTSASDVPRCSPPPACSRALQVWPAPSSTCCLPVFVRFNYLPGNPVAGPANPHNYLPNLFAPQQIRDLPICSPAVAWTLRTAFYRCLQHPNANQLMFIVDANFRRVNAWLASLTQVYCRPANEWTAALRSICVPHGVVVKFLQVS